MAEKPFGIWLCSILLISFFVLFAYYFISALLSGPDFIYSMRPELLIVDSDEDIETVWLAYLLISGVGSVLFLVNGILLLKAKPIARYLSLLSGVITFFAGGGIIVSIGGIMIICYALFDKKTKDYLKTK